jgi:hypothetical protein
MKVLSRRRLHELSTLQGSVRQLAQDRIVALRLFAASRGAATPTAQYEFWLEYAWIDQEYRAAVRRLASFCAHHGASPSTAERDAPYPSA